MSNVSLKTRIKHKYDTPENWAKATNFIPLEGELCIYNNGTGVKPEMKIGDGATLVGELPFLKAGGDVSVAASATTGTKVGTISIDGVATDLYAGAVTWSNVTEKPSYYDAKAIASISRSGTTFTATHLDGTTSTFTQQDTDTNTTYSAGTGLSLSGTTFNQVARTFTIGNGSFSYNGSANVSLATHSIFTSLTSDTTISWDDLSVGFTEMSGSNEVDWSGTNSPAGTAGFYRWGGALTLNRGGTGAFAQIYIAHNASSGNGILYRSGWYTDKKAWARILDSNNYTAYTVTKTGSGASGTWGISITGSSASCTGNAATASSTPILSTNSTANLSSCLQYFQSSTQTAGSDLPTETWWHIIKMNHGTGDSYYKRLLAFSFFSNDIKVAYKNGESSDHTTTWVSLWKQGDSVTGAVWNDYAEYRESEDVQFGRVLYEKGDDTLAVTTKRLQPFAGISSDTWGFCQGETERAKTPIAVAGRVLAYPYRNRNEYQPGDCLCAAPNGTVDIMTREEIERYPDRIVGTVSCVPTYEEWGKGDRPAVKVDGRIWVKVR